MLATWLIALGFLCAAEGAYLPGVMPKEYHSGDEVPLYVNNIISPHTLIPYSYYSLPVCRPKKIESESAARNLGKILSGSSAFRGLYMLNMLESSAPSCETVCGSLGDAVVRLSQEEVQIYDRLVGLGYQVEWIVDNLPVGRAVTEENREGQVFHGVTPRFPLGEVQVKDGAAVNVLYNHHELTVRYHREARFSGSRIVGVTVVPRSVRHSTRFASLVEAPNSVPLSCFSLEDQEPLYLNGSDASGLEVVWTYNVRWVEEPRVSWVTRWDALFVEVDLESHWLSLFTGLIIFVPLSVLTLAVFARTCGRSGSMNVEEEMEQTGWKLVHADVFRPPAHAVMLSALSGQGAQITLVVGLLALFSTLGMLAPPNRGAALSSMVMFSVLLAVFGGYVAARLYRQLKGKRNRLLLALCCLVVPGLVMTLYLGANVVLWVHASSAGLSVPMVIALLAMWLAFAVLTAGGLLLGLRSAHKPFPAAVNSIPRYVPRQPWYLARPLTLAAAGLIPFGVFWIEQYFVMQSLWSYSFISSFIFVLVALALLTACAAQVSILAVFLRLRCEDYHWWWPAFWHGAAPAVYIAVYGVYYVSWLQLSSGASVFLYLCYVMIFCTALALYLGAVGFFASLAFVTRIYSGLSVD